MAQRFKCPLWLFLRISFSWEMSRLRIYLQAITKKISDWNSAHNTTERFRYKPLICIIELLISEPSLWAMVGVGRWLSWQIACQARKRKDCWVRCSAPTYKHTSIPKYHGSGGRRISRTSRPGFCTHGHTGTCVPAPTNMNTQCTNNISLFLFVESQEGKRLG